MGSAVIRKIGLTGGIASGKSRVAEMLSQMLDCVRIDADELSRQVMEPHEEGWREFTRIFGSEYLAADGCINRPLLRRDLFSDDVLREKVNRVIHPIVGKELIVKMEHILESNDHSRVIVEVPLLYEVHWENLFDAVVVVYADDETCLSRLMERDGIEEKVAAKEIESQWPLSEKAMRTDYVIDNSGRLSETEKQVKDLVELMKNKGKGSEKKLDSEK